MTHQLELDVGYTPPLFPTAMTPMRRETFDRALEWPKAGGADLVTGPTDLFLSEEFKEAYRPGGKRAIYAAGCIGLATLAKAANVPVYKIGVTSPERLSARIEELRRDFYGAWINENGNWRKREGFGDWFASQLHPKQLPSPESPVRAGVRSITVTLPDGMTIEQFDTEFERQLDPCALDLWATTDAGIKHCSSRGIDPRLLQAGTRYPGLKLAPAREIYMFTIFSGGCPGRC
jgi:hypothetical protein